VPLAALFQAPTIEQLANTLRQGDLAVPWSPLVVVQPRGSKSPFFGIHIPEYSLLAMQLGPDQPLYALAPELVRKPMYTRVEDFAARYLKDVRSLQPKRPYFLGGYSFGGMVAFEMPHREGSRPWTKQPDGRLTCQFPQRSLWHRSVGGFLRGQLQKKT
jgi:hypothetical protein